MIKQIAAIHQSFDMTTGLISDDCVPLFGIGHELTWNMQPKDGDLQLQQPRSLHGFLCTRFPFQLPDPI